MNDTNIKIKNSVVNLSAHEELLREIEAFDLAKASPVDCHCFIRQLKERYAR